MARSDRKLKRAGDGALLGGVCAGIGRSLDIDPVLVRIAAVIVTVATGCPMERSIAEAYAQLILWMESDFGWDRWKAYDVLTHVGRISVGYYGIGTVGTKIEKKYLASPPSA